MRFPTLALVAQALAVSADPTLTERQSGARAFATNQNLSLRLSEIAAPVSGPGNPNGLGTWELTINDTPSGQKQTVKGFGGTVTDATVTVINALPAAARSRLLRELLTTDGARFSLLRHTIGASDLSAPPAYTYDDGNGQADPNMNNFSLGDRGSAMARLLAEMKRINPSALILGSTWSAPGWMKLSRRLTGTTQGNNLDPQYYAAYARYFVRYLQAYAGLGVTVDAITIQNEPLNSQGGGHVTMYQSADEAAHVTQNFVGPALRAAGLNTQIWAYDHNTDNPGYADTVVNRAGNYVQAAAWHCYIWPIDWSVISQFRSRHPTKGNHMTECWTSPSTSWYQSSSNTIGPLQNWVESSGMWTLGTWTNRGDGTFGPYIPGGCATCRGLFMVNQAAGTYEYTIDYYILAQYSKYIPPGAKILSGTGSYQWADQTGIQSVASRNPDGTRTVVIQSTMNSDLHLTLKTQTGQTWSGRVPANTVVTWLLPQ